MVRPPSCEDSTHLTKGAWSKEEDAKLINYMISKNGHEKWKIVAKRAGLNRCGKSCRLRWINYLQPGIKRGNFSKDEVELIIELHKGLGNRWATIAGYLAGRTDNDIKNYWNTHMRKKLRANIVPMTHQPFLNPNLLPLLNLMTYPGLNNAFDYTNNLQLPLNLGMEHFHVNYPFYPINQLQHSQNSLMQMINPNPSPNLFNPFAEISCPQQEPFHDINNIDKSPQVLNTLPSVPIEPEFSNLCYNNLNTNYALANEVSLPNLVSYETPNIVNQIESNLSPMPSLDTLMFEDWDKLLEYEADVMQWP